VTFDGLTSSEWFRLAIGMALTLALCVLLWFIGQQVRRAVRFLTDHRRRSARRWERRMDAARERRFRSQTPMPYLRERAAGTVSETPTPWPFRK
jgi:hypothetical protein